MIDKIRNKAEKNEKFEAKIKTLQTEKREFEEKIDLEKMKREDAEFASGERIRVADEKVDILRSKNEQQNKQEKK